MVLVGVIGNPRTGKTLVTTVMIKRLVDRAISMGAKINIDRFYYANYHFLDYLKPLINYLYEPADMMQIRLPELYSGVVDLDELYVWLESRGSGASSINKILSHIAFQSGKSGFDILWSAQLSSSVDKRVRLLTDYFIVALTPTEYSFRYAYVSSNRIKRFKLSRIKATEYYPYYDTREKIVPLEVEQELRIKALAKPSPKPIDSLEENAIKVINEDKDLVEEEKKNDFELHSDISHSDISGKQVKKEMQIIPIDIDLSL